MSDCPPDEVLAAHVGGTLSTDASARIATHLDTCAACRDIVVGALRGNRAETEMETAVVSPSRPTEPDESYCPSCSGSFAPGTELCPHDGARLVQLSVPTDDMLGTTLDGRYDIDAVIGTGGMGTVYGGRQLSVDREVAIKVIHPRLAADRSAVKRFLREARLASKLAQPNIVSVYDFGQTARVLYLVMEHLRGATLATLLRREGALSSARAVAIAIQLCDALAAAHELDIVHRDLKPSNIMILEGDVIKVLDFGLAKSLEHEASRVTHSDAIVGTPLYMSPELIESEVSDRRSDLYALGCILFEMVSGAPPFTGGSPSVVITKHAFDPVPALPPAVPRPLRALIRRLLAKSPDERPQTAREVRTALEQIASHPWRAARWPLRAALAAAGLAVAGALAFGATRLAGSPDATAPAAPAPAPVPPPAPPPISERTPPPPPPPTPALEPVRTAPPKPAPKPRRPPPADVRPPDKPHDPPPPVLPTIAPPSPGSGSGAKRRCANCPF